MSLAKTSTNLGRSRKIAEQSKNKFSNSIIDEESIVGFSMTGGGKNAFGRAGGAEEGAAGGVGESSIMDEVSVAGFGGSRTLQGRIVSRKDGKGG